MKKIKMPQIVPNGFGASIGLNEFFCSRQNRFWGPFGGLLAFGYYLDRDFLMLIRWGFSDVF
jgi:hypothetical protein